MKPNYYQLTFWRETETVDVMQTLANALKKYRRRVKKYEDEMEELKLQKSKIEKKVTKTQRKIDKIKRKLSIGLGEERLRCEKAGLEFLHFVEHCMNNKGSTQKQFEKYFVYNCDASDLIDYIIYEDPDCRDNFKFWTGMINARASGLKAGYKWRETEFDDITEIKVDIVSRFDPDVPTRETEIEPIEITNQIFNFKMAEELCVTDVADGYDQDKAEWGDWDDTHASVSLEFEIIVIEFICE